MMSRLIFLLIFLRRIFADKLLNSLEVKFIIDDNTPAGHLVGDIARQTTGFPWPKIRSDTQRTNGISDIHVKIKNNESEYLDLVQDIFIANTAGEIYTLKDIDRDNENEFCGLLNCCMKLMCELSFTVKFTNTRTHESVQVNVHVFIHDKNDNSPKFSISQLDYEIIEHFGENRAHNWKVFLPKALDLDSSVNGVKNYELKGPMTSTSFFILNKTDLSMEVNSKQLLDYENRSIPKLFELSLDVYDGGYPSPKEGSLPIRIKLIDQDDNPPIFDPLAKYKIEIPENKVFSKPVFKFEAFDLDEDGKQAVSYYLNCRKKDYCSHFKLDTISGELILINPIDYEALDSGYIPLHIQAKSGKESSYFSTNVTLHVYVNDVNDNKPIIEIVDQKPLKENEIPREAIINISVSDRDRISDGMLSCSWTYNNETRFKLVKVPKIPVTRYEIFALQEFDREKTERVPLLFTCFDNAPESKKTELKLFVEILDLNDNKPTFISPSWNNLNLTFPEDVSPGEPLYQFRATDLDYGSNGRIVYGICCQTVPFVIDSESGVLSVSDSLDFEKFKNFKFSVIARDDSDQKQSRLSSSIDVTIEITDVNDNSPKLVSPKTVNFPENQLGYLCDILMKDDDTGEGGLFEYHLNNYLDVFKLLENGSLIVVRSLDREENEEIDLEILAKDKGYPVSLTSVSKIKIKIDDVDDCEPELKSPRNYSTISFQPVISSSKNTQSKDNMKISNIELKDSDLEKHSKFIFKEINQSLPFEMNPDLNALLLKPDPVSNNSWINENYPVPGLYEYKFEVTSYLKNQTHYFWIFVRIHKPKYDSDIINSQWPSDGPELFELERRNGQEVSSRPWYEFLRLFDGKTKKSITVIVCCVLILILIIAFICIFAALAMWVREKKNRRVFNRKTKNECTHEDSELEIDSFCNFCPQNSSSVQKRLKGKAASMDIYVQNIYGSCESPRKASILYSAQNTLENNKNTSTSSTVRYNNLTPALEVSMVGESGLCLPLIPSCFDSNITSPKRAQPPYVETPTTAFVSQLFLEFNELQILS